MLKLDGRLRMAETMSRWEGDKRAELLGMIGALGFRLIGTVEERDRFLYIDALRAWGGRRDHGSRCCSLQAMTAARAASGSSSQLGVGTTATQ